MAKGPYEGELARWLYAYGWAMVRAPSSGSATQREQPDIVAGRGGRHGPYVAIEVKSTSGEYVYLQGDERDALVEFANTFGATPMVSCRFKGKGKHRGRVHYVVPLAALHRTPKGYYGIKLADAVELAEMTITDPDK